MKTPTLERVPLFPLNAVLFPGSRLPLRIFEERYKVLYQDALKAGARFGIVLIKEGSEVGETAVPFDVGTLAEIEAVDHHGDQLFLLCRGTQRFRIQELHHDKPYLTGSVEVLPEPAHDRGETAAADALAERFREYLERMRVVAGALGGELRAPPLAADLTPRQLVNSIAFRLPLDLAEKQMLLESESFNEVVSHLEQRLLGENEFMRPDA